MLLPILLLARWPGPGDRAGRSGGRRPPQLHLPRRRQPLAQPSLGPQRNFLKRRPYCTLLPRGSKISR